MGDDNNYNSDQNPPGNYSGSQNPGTLYADNTTTKPPSQAAPVPSQPAAAPSFIQIAVNPESKLKPVPFTDLITKTPGLPAGLKDKIKFDSKTNTIQFPDLSKTKAEAGKEWLVDLGKAGNDWEYTTATLVLVIDNNGYFKLKPDFQEGEERGFNMNAGKKKNKNDDEDNSLLEPAYDLRSISKGIIVGLTIPSEAMFNKSSSLQQSVPPTQIARLKSGKGLILIASRLIVAKKDKFSVDSVPVPNSMMAMACLHELSGHASFFQQGQSAAHSDPMDPANNPVDKNTAQLAQFYKASIDKEQPAFEQKVKTLVTAFNKAVP